ncbi:MAG TPA: hypothetical protein VGO47_10980, partial [Chlamydiales bacterium]|nr:hypothetical protein [Chlamydiales bacterium]
MSRQCLPADVWIYIAENFLRKQDCLNLARTTRDTRACLLPLVFRTLRFNGHITPADTQACMREDMTPQEYLRYLQFHQERIIGLQTKSSYLLDSVKSVEIWNWAYTPPNLLQTSSPNSKGTLSSQVLNSWFLTYKKIVEFAIKLPAIRTLVFHECQYGRSLHGDASPFGYTTILPSTDTLGCGYTACEWLHYSCKNLSPSSFQTPGQFIYQRDTSDMKVTLRKKYLKEILQVCPLSLIEFRHTLVTIFSLDLYNWSATFRDPKKLTG